MSGMAEQKTDPSIRFLAQVAFSTILWCATFVLTRSQWLARQTSLTPRVAQVVIGIGGFLPIVYVYAKSIRMQDEFNQRIHLVALSVAYALLAVTSYASDLLHRSHFIPELPATGLWGLMIAIWFVTMIVTPRFYR
jgi:hypothetical protein